LSYLISTLKKTKEKSNFYLRFQHNFPTNIPFLSPELHHLLSVLSDLHGVFEFQTKREKKRILNPILKIVLSRKYLVSLSNFIAFFFQSFYLNTEFFNFNLKKKTRKKTNFYFCFQDNFPTNIPFLSPELHHLFSELSVLHGVFEFQSKKVFQFVNNSLVQFLMNSIFLVSMNQSCGSGKEKKSIC